MITAADVLDFWFGEADPTREAPYRPAWFAPDPAFDALVASRLGAAADAAVAGGFAAWEEAVPEALALVLLLDQVPRNRYRGDRRAFDGDARARRVAAGIIDKGGDRPLARCPKLFLYLPFEHSERLADQDRACRLIGALGDAAFTAYAERHRAVIRRFGRFPHRNASLGRPSSDAERAFLASADEGF